MRSKLGGTLLLVHIFSLLLTCGALLVSGRVFLPDAPNQALFDALLPGCAVAALLAVAGGLFIMKSLAPLNKVQKYAETADTGATPLKAEDCGAFAPLAESVRALAARNEERADWFTGILNSLPQSISVTDMDMHWTFCNTASLKSMNKTCMDEVCGRHCSEKKGNICNTPQCGIQQLRQGNKRVINQMPNGKTMQITLDYLVDKSGQRIGHVEIGEDVTEKFRLEEESRQAADKARALMVEQLEGVVNTLRETVDTVDASLSNASSEAETAAARLAETATAMNEMNSTVAEVAHNAEDAADAATSMQKEAHGGNELVGKTIKSLQGVREYSASLKTDMEGLDNQVTQISTVLALISDIADQTNLLALNAAIEAARAGEAGRGFAVVADSVRNLAEKTMHATQEVEAAISAIQKSTSQSSATVDGATNAIDEAGQVSEESGRALQQISALAEDSSSRISAIAAAATEQSAASDEINRNIFEANRISGEIAGTMKNAAGQVGEMAEQIHVLMDILESVRAQSSAGSSH